MWIKSVTDRSLWRVGPGRSRYWLLGLVSAIALLLLALAGPAQAAYPAFLDAYVNDYGQVLSDGEKSLARAQLDQFRRRTGVHAVLLTVNSIYDYGTGDAALEPFATNLFNTWGIGDAGRNDGILLLVAPGDRQVRIELGMGYDRSYDRVAQAIVDDAMLPQFRQGNIGQGTLIGVNQIVQKFDPSSPPAVNPVLAYLPPELTEWVSPQVAIGGGLAAGGVGLFAGGLALKRLQRYRPRHCGLLQGVQAAVLLLFGGLALAVGRIGLVFGNKGLPFTGGFYLLGQVPVGGAQVVGSGGTAGGGGGGGAVLECCPVGGDRPFEQNHGRYHNNWVRNLLIASSLNGRRPLPKKADTK
ncbi:TPM domain-containing protein [Leptolyngbya sp. KIOST-1]|uniref:TPM domain-containing protein n=1 Tax=Leptolyngbya sp. KIOST-1 TaxID=1229172 RepID=UPI0009DFB7A9|nr:TPM domain-containing protein [Leptolyngbya sp. KIOST-1]